MAYLELSGPTTNSCSYEVYLSSSFNQSNYKEVRITSTDYDNSTSDVRRYVAYNTAPTSGTSRYVRGTIDDGMSAGRTYTLYAYAQAVNGTWYRAGTDTITMQDEAVSEKKFDYGISSLEVVTAEPYKIGDEIRIRVKVKNYRAASGPDYKIELRDKDGSLVERKYKTALDGEEYVTTSLYPVLKSEEVQNNQIKYTITIKADESGWTERDFSDNEKTVVIDVEAPAAPEKISENVSVNDQITSGQKWYYVTFAEAGKANFFLQPQSSSLDVDLRVYKSDQTTRLASSTNNVGEDDMISGIAVAAGERYYIKVSYVKGSGSYMLRCKNYPATNNVMDKLKDNTSLGLTQSKKNTMIKMGTVLLDAGFELGFVAGVLGNIQYEADTGLFESSAYNSNPSAKPAYLKYVDTHFDYATKFSGKNIKNVGIKATKELIDKCAAVNYQGKFGLGCVQWTGGRTMTLINCYISVCGANAFPTAEQCYEAEAKLIVDEFKNAYNSVYTEWRNNFKNSANAGYEAGSLVCRKYEIPAGYQQKAITRGNSAQAIYNVLK